MGLQFIDRVRVTTATTGTGAIAIGAAVAGYQGFSGMTVGNTAYYTIEDGANWEIGLGTLTAAGTFARTTVISTSAGNTSPIALDGAAVLYLGWTAEAIALYATLNAPQFTAPSWIGGASGDTLALGGAAGPLAPILWITDTGTADIEQLALSAPNATYGANIKLTGNGATTPTKYIRVTSGDLLIINSANSAPIFGLDDVGDLSIGGSLTATGLTISGAAPVTIGSGSGQNNLVGAWTAYTPTVTAASGTLAAYTVVGRYLKMGRRVDITINITVTSNGTGAIQLIASLPFESAGAYYSLSGHEIQATGLGLACTIDANSATVGISTDGNGYPVASSGTSVIVVTGTYEAIS